MIRAWQWCRQSRTSERTELSDSGSTDYRNPMLRFHEVRARFGLLTSRTSQTTHVIRVRRQAVRPTQLEYLLHVFTFCSSNIHGFLENTRAGDVAFRIGILSRGHGTEWHPSPSPPTLLHTIQPPFLAQAIFATAPQQIKRRRLSSGKTL